MNIPRIMETGAYDPVQMEEFLDAAIKDGMKNWAIAEALSVPIDRVTYFLGNGRDALRRQADSRRMVMRLRQMAGGMR